MCGYRGTHLMNEVTYFSPTSRNVSSTSQMHSRSSVRHQQYPVLKMTNHIGVIMYIMWNTNPNAINSVVDGYSVYYAKGQFIRGEDIKNKEYFKKKMKSLKKHETKNKRHVAVATIMLEELEICAANMLTKTQIGYELFSRAEPDTLYPKLLRLIYRIGKIDNYETEIGSYGQGKDMVVSLRDIFMTYIRTKLQEVLSHANSGDNFGFFFLYQLMVGVKVY
eukprot:331983_1